MDGPAARAWQRLGVGSDEIRGVRALKEGKYSAAYRLRGVGRDGSDVIAKWRSPEAARVERAVYESILPQLPLATLKYYGAVAAESPRAGAGPWWWLFVEDGGGKKFSPADAALRVHAGRWLARLHVSAAGVLARAETRAGLPERGPDYFFGHLRAALAALAHNLANRALSAAHHRMIGAVLAQCNFLDARWGAIDDSCRRVPCTLFHGDFAGRNIRVRVKGEETTLWPFDWEDAAWGPPALDLIQSSPQSLCPSANPDLAAYAADVRARWPDVNAGDLRRLGAIGKVFWFILAIRLDAESLGPEWVDKPMRNLKLYRGGLTHALRALGWKVWGG